MEKYDENPIDDRGNILYGSTRREEFTRFLGGQDALLFVETIGITNPDPEYSISRQKCDYIVLEYVLSGKGYVIADNKTYDVESDCVYILLPGKSHSYGSDKNCPYKKIWINIFSDLFVDIIKAFKLDHQIVFRRQSVCEKYFQQLLSIAENSYVNDNIYFEVSKIIFNILAEIAEQRAQIKQISSIAHKAQRLLDDSIYTDKKINDIAKELFVSVPYLIKVFSEQYNTTPYQYYLAKKIQAAKFLLKSTNAQIKSISEQLYFADEHYFSNLFKQKVGMSPKSYRKNWSTQE